MITDNKFETALKTARDYRPAGAYRDGVVTPVTLGIATTTTSFKILAAFAFSILNKIRTKAITDNIAFTAAHVVTDGGWGSILIQSDLDGNISTKITGATQTTAMNYATEALALAAVPSPDAGKVKIAVFTINPSGVNFTANTTVLSAVGLLSMNYLGEFPDRRWKMFRPGVNFAVLEAETFCRSLTATVQAEVFAAKQASEFNQVLTAPNLEVDRRTVANATVTKLRFSHFDYVIDGVTYHTPSQKQLAFSAAHVVTADKWGAILLQIDATGTYSTKVGEATQTTAMAYTNAANARAALPEPDAGCKVIGALIVEAKNANWTANTDDIVAASDLEDFQLVPATSDRLLSRVTLAIDAVPEKFQITAAFDYTIRGVRLTKAAAAAIAFSAAHVCSASKYLPILISVDNAGTVTSRVPLIDGLSQTAAQGYDSYNLAVQALATPLADKDVIGFIVVLADAGGWTAQTDDMTPGSDLTSVWFNGFTPEQKVTVTALNYIPTTRRNRLYPVSGAAFVANLPTTTPAVDDIVSGRGWEHGMLGIFLAASATAVCDDPDVTVTQRPWPMGGEATV